MYIQILNNFILHAIKIIVREKSTFIILLIL